ncbi:hypothetical protein IT570_04845 [Candidatus Sumerlaeota bacterium]|nr:hypothetical protein [Candidatus Sumerlaeota bacterium]
MHFKKLDIALFSVTALLVAILFLFAWHAYPPPNGDSLAFIPAAISYARGDGLISPVWKYAVTLDPTGAHRFLNHGPYYPIVVGALMPKADVYGALFAIRLIDSVVLLLGACVGRLFLVRLGAWNWKGCLLVILTLGGICTHLVWSLRPERLALLCYILVAMIWLFWKGSTLVALLASAALHAFAGTVHPLAALMLAPVVLAYFSVRWRCAELLRHLSIHAGATLATFLLLMHLSPHGLADSLAGQRTMTQVLVVEGRTAQAWEFLFHFVTDPRKALFGVVIVGGCVCGVIQYGRHRRAIASPAGFHTAIAFLLLIVYYFILRKPSTVYNFVPFYPVLVALILWWFAQTNRWWVAAFLLASNVVSFARWLVLFPFFLQGGVTLEDARARFESLAAEVPGTIGGTNIVWTFTEHYDRLFDYPSNVQAIQATEDHSYLVIQQFAYGGMNPEPIAHHALMESRFHSHSVRLLGINLGNRMPDYAFAIYAPDAAPGNP